MLFNYLENESIQTIFLHGTLKSLDYRSEWRKYNYRFCVQSRYGFSVNPVFVKVQVTNENDNNCHGKGWIKRCSVQ